LRFRPARLKKLLPLALRNATDSELGRIKGDWERLEIAYVKAIAPDLAQKYLDQARRTLQRAYERGVRDSGLLSVMGLCEIDAGEDALAREYLETAALLGPMRPRAWYELARLRLTEFRALAVQAQTGLTSEQAAAVLRPLFTARESDPPLPEVYELIAEVWENCAVAPTRGHLLVLDEGVRFFPRQSTLIYRAAELNLRHGFQPAAIELVTLGLNGAGDDAMRQRFLLLQDQIEK
jgi:tetratricopeptide (TPR) repeat protein